MTDDSSVDVGSSSRDGEVVDPRYEKGISLQAAPHFGRKFPVYPLFILALVSLVDQVDAGVLRGVLPFLQDDFGLSDFQLGTLGFSFVFVNAIATIPAGWVADHYKRTRVIGLTLLSWSALTLLSAVAVNYASMLMARTVMGIGQSVDDPASTSLLGDYFPAQLRGKVFAWQQVSFFVGSGLGLAIGAVVAEQWHWRWAFVIVAFPSALVAVAVARLREPRRGEAELDPKLPWSAVEALGVEADERIEAESLGEFLREVRTQLVRELKVVFGIRTMRYILVGVSALLFTVSGIGFWLAIYHERFSGYTIEEATLVVAGVLGLGGLFGTFLGGWASDRFAYRFRGGRIVIVVWSTVACAVLFMVSFAVQNIELRVALQFLGVLSAAGAAPGLRAAMMDVMPAESRGVGASAFALTAAVLGTAAAPPVVGLLADLTGSLVRAFVIVFPPVIFGLLLLLRARDTLAEDAQAILLAIHQPDGQ